MREVVYVLSTPAGNDTVSSQTDSHLGLKPNVQSPSNVATKRF